MEVTTEKNSVIFDESVDAVEAARMLRTQAERRIHDNGLTASEMLGTPTEKYETTVVSMSCVADPIVEQEQKRKLPCP